MLPAAASFKRQGANRGALSAFLVTTPESGIDSIAITYALLGPIMAVVRPVAALVTGITAGFWENSLHDPDQDQARPAGALQMIPLRPVALADHEKKPRMKLLAAMRYAAIDVWGDIAGWFFIGLVLAAVITVFLPNDVSEMVLGGGLVSMLTMLAVGMPVYICATASTPVAAALLLKGASPGAVLVFLLAGPATNLTSLSVLIRILGKRGTLRYLFVVAIVSVLFGLGLDKVYQLAGIAPQAIVSEVGELAPAWLKLGCAWFLITLSGYHLWRWLCRRCAAAETGMSWLCGMTRRVPAPVLKQRPQPPVEGGKKG